MKKFLKNSKAFFAKLMLAALLLAVIGSVLVSCVGSGVVNAPKVEIKDMEVTGEHDIKLSADNREIYKLLEKKSSDYDALYATGALENGVYVPDVEKAKDVIKTIIASSDNKELKYDYLTEKDIKDLVTKYEIDRITDYVKRNENVYVELRATVTDGAADLEAAKAILSKNTALKLDFLTAGNVTDIIRKQDVDASDLDKIATFIANNREAYEAFVAAYRGYDVVDMTYGKEETFDGIKDADGNYIVNVEAAKKVLAKYDTDKTLKYDTIGAADIENIVMTLRAQTVVDFNETRGFLDNIYYWIGVALKWITNTVGFGNYILGICIIAIVFELLLLPLSIKQQKSSIKMAMLRTKEMAIQKKYAGRNDQATRQKMSQEIMEMRNKENANPFSGCLPLLVQLPIVIILYNVVIDPVKHVLGMASDFSTAIVNFCTTSKAAGGLGEALTSKSGSIEALSIIKERGFEGIKDFLFFENSAEVYENLADIQSGIPSFNIGSVNLGYTPSFTDHYWLLLVPVLTFLTYFLSMRISRKLSGQTPAAGTDDRAAGCSNTMMDFMMPVFSVFICFGVPAALGVYWMFKSIISTIKQIIISKIMPLPKFTEEDYKAAEKELSGKNKDKPVKRERDPNAPRARSLHHIDDEDYDEKGNYIAPAKAPEVKADETPVEAAPLKSDDKKKKNKTEDDNTLGDNE